MDHDIHTFIKQTSNGWILTVVESAPSHQERVAPYRYCMNYFLSSHQDAIALQNSYTNSDAGVAV